MNVELSLRFTEGEKPAGTTPTPVLERKGLPADLLQQLRAALLDCAPIQNESAFLALFVEERIRPWQDTIPHAEDPTGRADAVIAYLYGRDSGGENGLALLLDVLVDRVPVADSCHGRLRELAGQVREAVKAEVVADEAKEVLPALRVSLFRPDSGVYTEPVDFDPPLDEDVLEDLRWYLEEFPTWPTEIDRLRAGNIMAQMEKWGQALFENVISTPKAATIWTEFHREGGGLLTIDATDPRVLRLPWELLADEAGHLFNQQVSIRRRMRKTTSSQRVGFGLPVRILVVVARPVDAPFIDPRADSISLLDAVDELRGRVAVEFLYPPTICEIQRNRRIEKLIPQRGAT